MIKVESEDIAAPASVSDRPGCSKDAVYMGTSGHMNSNVVDEQGSHSKVVAACCSCFITVLIL